MMKFIQKHKDDRIKKLKTRVIELENENETLEDKNTLLKKELFKYKLKRGKAAPHKRRPLMKVMGNHKGSVISKGGPPR
jgi:hypothetical protein